MGRKYGCQMGLEVATASNILICDYLVSQRKELLNLITVASKCVANTLMTSRIDKGKDI